MDIQQFHHSHLLYNHQAWFTIWRWSCEHHKCHGKKHFFTSQILFLMSISFDNQMLTNAGDAALEYKSTSVISITLHIVVNQSSALQMTEVHEFHCACGMTAHRLCEQIVELLYSQPGLFGSRGYSGHNTKWFTNGRCPAQIAPRTQSHLTHSFCKTQHPND